MRITSKWNGGQVFVRVFGPTDTVYVFGRWEALLKFGETIDFNLPEGKLQLEIKQGGLFGPFIVRPGHVWSNSDVRILNADGDLVVPDAHTASTDVNADLDVTIKYVFLGAEKSLHERIQRAIHVSGPAAQRRLNVDDFSISRDATTTIEALHGAFSPSSGALSLSANVKVSLAGLILGEGPIGLTTGGASSGGRFSDTGAPYDPTSRRFKLVGGGMIAGAEFFVVVEATTAAPLT